MKKLRVFHFDIKTLGNYGDTLLFEMVRQLFNGFSNRQAFQIDGSASLRNAVGPKLIEMINRHYDAVIVGGGGLFLRDTNPNERSGWQWSCSMNMLERLEKPVILFGVGNNRFIAQDDFTPLFSEHINRVMDKSVFFGLRNHGSVDSIRAYIRPENRDRVRLQPCPTTLAAHLCPDLVRDDFDPPKRIGFQVIVGKRQVAAGFNRDEIYGRLADVVQRLQADEWEVEVIAHARADVAFYEFLVSRGIEARLHKMFGDSDIFAGLRYYADLPITVGTRGHAQMIPFGAGNPIVSLMVHDKIRYFLDDVGHSEQWVDPRGEQLADELFETIQRTYREFAGLRSDFHSRQRGMLEMTLNNLSEIYRNLAGEEAVPNLVPYSAFERFLASHAYNASLRREALESELQAARERHDAALRETEARREEDEAERNELSRELRVTREERDRVVRERDASPIRRAIKAVRQTARGVRRAVR